MAPHLERGTDQDEASQRRGARACPWSRILPTYGRSRPRPDSRGACDLRSHKGSVTLAIVLPSVR